MLSQSRWGDPLKESEIKTFFDTYMPWASTSAYSVRKQQQQTLLSSVERSASSMVREMGGQPALRAED